MLQAQGLVREYGTVTAVDGIDLSLARGEFLTIFGPNGAGKTTTLKSISNLLASERGVVSKGAINYQGARIDALTPNVLVKRGVIQVMEGRHCFEHLTVEENLLTGAYTRSGGDRKRVVDDLELVYNYFPRLKDRFKSLAGYISGGEQQMVAIGRALMARPKLMLLDEPSMGLAPQLVEEIFEIVKRLNEDEKVTFLLAEQNTNMALRYSRYGYILENGRVVMDGDAQTLLGNEDIKEFYLGASGGDQHNFRDMKQYRRRKRWLS